MEETHITPAKIRQFYCFGDLNRDPRGRTISIAYIALVDPDQICQAGNDAADAIWFSLNALPALAFDHREMITKALEHSQF